MKRFIDDKPYWHDRQINESTGSELTRSGFIPHSPNFKLGRPLLNEIFYLRPDLAFGNIAIPTLIIHGTNDSFIPIQSSRDHIARISAATRLVEIDGAQHGIAVRDDPQYLNPQTQAWQADAIREIAAWLA